MPDFQLKNAQKNAEAKTKKIPASELTGIVPRTGVEPVRV